MDDWREKGMDLFRENWWILLALGIGLVLLLSGRVMNFFGEEAEVEIIEADLGPVTGRIWVDVGGAVEKPDVYELVTGARVKDALAAAGGLSEEADRVRIAREINLAAEIKDGVKLYFVREGEESVAGMTTVTGPGSPSSGIISINTASAIELDKLWGIGPSRAEQIIAGRPYASVEELKTKGGVPLNVYERIEGQVGL